MIKEIIKYFYKKYKLLIQNKLSRKYESYYGNNNLYVQPLSCTSQICNQEFWGFPFFKYWALAMKENPLRFHRKLWEYVYIAQVLYENNCLFKGKRGLGFAVGQEPLPALFASFGVKILATDMVENSDEQAKMWINLNQNSAGDISKLNNRNICTEELFNENVKFQNCDMNNINSEFNGFDFIWSACAIEHIGGYEKTVNFLLNSMNCLRSGGIAVHTTEYNLSSNNKTIENPYSYLFREKDIKNIINLLESKGHYVYPLDLRHGVMECDRYVDNRPYIEKMHLRLLQKKYVTTSIGIIIKKM